jgi:hypothetical protein
VGSSVSVPIFVIYSSFVAASYYTIICSYVETPAWRSIAGKENGDDRGLPYRRRLFTFLKKLGGNHRSSTSARGGACAPLGRG